MLASRGASWRTLIFFSSAMSSPELGHYSGSSGLSWTPDPSEQHLLLARLLQRVDQLERRDTVLEAKVAALEDRNARLEATIRALVLTGRSSSPVMTEATPRAQLVTCEATVVPAVAAMPFLDDQLFLLVANHVDTRTLGRLARVAKRFGLCRPGGRPIVEEVAEQRLAHIIAEQHCTLLWQRQQQHEPALAALHRAERVFEPHRFSHWGPEVLITDYKEDSGRLSVAQKFDVGFETAVCEQVMYSGRHFVECEILASGAEGLSVLPMVGVVGPEFDPAGGRPAWRSSVGRMYYAGDGQLNHDGEGSDWDGMAPVTLSWEDLNAGDAVHSVGLLLDLDAGSLEVYLHEENVGYAADRLEYWERLGVMVPAGVLAPPLRWAVDLADGAKVHVRCENRPLTFKFPCLCLSQAGLSCVANTSVSQAYFNRRALLCRKPSEGQESLVHLGWFVD